MKPARFRRSLQLTPLIACVLLASIRFSVVAQTTFAYDLDSDGTNDTNLALTACSDGGNQTLCLRVDSNLVRSREIRLANSPNVCDGSVQRMGDKIHLIGDYNHDRLSEVSVLFCRNPTPSLAVVDVATATVIGSTTAPAGQIASYTDFPRDPSGTQHPFLANSYADEEPESARRWDNMCIFRPDRDSSPECGPGFSKVNQLPVNAAYYSFRETGGYLQDIDGDGWEDINLLYEYITLTISPNTLTTIAQTEFDVARSEPDAALNFHSGRQYGTHSAVTAIDGSLRDVMVGGTPLSAFGDPVCNVSRFVGVLESTPGSPSSRSLKWSKYYGFHSAIFSFAPERPMTVLRPPDVENGCIHRFGDSRSLLAGSHVLVFNVFNQIAPASTCLPEQFAFYSGDTAAWVACIAKNLKAIGTWDVQVLNESDGTPIFRSRNTYVWGWVNGMIPGDETVYLTESVPGPVPFDRTDRSQVVIEARVLNPAGWQRILRVPSAERPVISRAQPAAGRGAASYTGYSHLRTTDFDHDGLLDVQLADGSWVGYSQSLGRLEVKAKPALTAAAWSSAVGVKVTGSTVTKTTSDGWGNATAASALSISGDGYFEFAVSEADTIKAVGLAHGNATPDVNDFDFALNFSGDGTVSASELGVARGALGTYARGDVFRLGVFGGVALYFRNGVLLRKGDPNVAYPLHLSASLYSAGSTIADVKVTGTMPTPPMPLASLTLAEDPGAAHSMFMPITLRATAMGGTTPYQFKWWFSDGSAWTLAKDWSASSTFTWVPRAAGTNYAWKIYGRSAGHTGDEYDMVASSLPVTIAAANATAGQHRR
jgi:hypothetical protein